jgi:hypothetical protein
MERSPSPEAKSSSVSQQVLRVVLNAKVHNSPPLVSIPSQINPVHDFPSYLFKIQFNIILPRNA